MRLAHVDTLLLTESQWLPATPWPSIEIELTTNPYVRIVRPHGRVGDASFPASADVGDARAMIVFIILYLSACVVTGMMGRHTVFGFVGHFLLSILITPFLDFLILAVSRPRRGPENG